MATNPNTLPENVGRITAPDAEYPYGSAKDDTTGTAGDGTPIREAMLNDSYGLQQALLLAAGITPSGNADTATESEYLQGIIQQAMGRAITYDDSGLANAYVLGKRANQQGPGAPFDGMRVTFRPLFDNTGAATIDLSDLFGQVVGTTVVNIKRPGAVDDPGAGEILAGFDSVVVYRTVPSVHAELQPLLEGFTATDQILQFGEIIVQWGLTGGSNGSYNFNTAFPNEVLTIVGTPSTGSNSMAGLYISSVTTTSFVKTTALDEGNPANFPVRYLAIGR